MTAGAIRPAVDAEGGPAVRAGPPPRAAFRAYARGRDPALRARLIEAHLPLAFSVARRFAGGPVPLEDLMQVACVGLIAAVDRYDPDRGPSFTSFAVPTIQGQLLHHLRDQTWAIRVPRDLQERALRVERERARLTGELGRSPTAAELGRCLGCSVEELLDASEAAGARSPRSLDQPAADEHDDGDMLVDRLGDEDGGFAAAEATVLAEDLLSRLPPRDRAAVELRFRDDLTQTEIGARLGRSQMQVSRILSTSLARLRREAEALQPERRPDGNRR